MSGEENSYTYDCSKAISSIRSNPDITGDGVDI